MVQKTWALARDLLLVGVLVFSACQPQTVVVEKEVIKEVEKEVTRIVEREVTKIVTKIVTKRETVQVQVTPTPTAIPQGGSLSLSSLADVDILNPFTSSDGASSEIEGFLWDSSFEVDPWTGKRTPGLVESWDVTDGNKTVTFHVRQGPTWSDGEPITAHDPKFMLDALTAVDSEGNPVLAESPRLDLVEHVETVELIDDYTLQVTYSEPLCGNPESVNLPWWPSHHFLSDPDFEWADLADHPFGWEPTIFSGPFMLKEWVEGDHVTMVRNPNYWKGAPHLDGIVWKVVTDVTRGMEMLKAGEIDVGGIEPEFLAEMEQVERLDIYKFLGTRYAYIGLQQGEPDNPQPRLNKDGTVNANHGAHPILSKKEVRQALVYAIDRSAIINKVSMGQGTLLNAHIVPTYGWAYNDELEPRGYDPENAGALLDAAGWPIDGATGIRRCLGCGTTDDGTPMRLNLKTNAENKVHEDIIAIIQQQLGEIGIEVEIEAMEWTAYLDVLLGQSFDMVVIGWTNVSEDNERLFLAKYDIPGGGFNLTSFYRPDYELMELEAKTVPGCSYEDRGAIYREIQEILYSEQPYVWLFADRAIQVVSKRLGNVNPGPWSTFHNVEEWYIKE